MTLPAQSTPATYEYKMPTQVCIESIDALYNPLAEMAFQQQVHALESAHRQRGVAWPGADMRYSYHGTKPNLVATLIETGLRGEFNVTGSYGYGIYVAQHASYSASYAPPDSKGVSTMFVCRTIVNGCRRTLQGDMRPGTGAITPQTTWIPGANGLPGYPVIVGTDNPADPHLFALAENASCPLQYRIAFRGVP